MARKCVILQNEHPYHVRARSNNREWFYLPLEHCWSIYSRYIKETSQKYGFATHNFVLMKNHFHWNVSTPSCNLSEGMQYFMSRTSIAIARSAGRINRIYGSRY